MSQNNPTPVGGIKSVDQAKPVVAQPELVKPEVQKPLVIMSELDSYIHERMREQPESIDAVKERAEVTVVSREKSRIALPEFFEKFSYDNPKTPGEFVFRWILRDKRAIDRAMNVLGWTLVNRVYFPDVPRHLLTANGGVENGDAILAFMPFKKALEIRNEPSKRSRELLKSRITNVDEDFAMMGDPKDKKFYKPDLSSEADEETQALVEGRDF